MAINGKYYSAYLTTELAGDLLDLVKADLGVDSLMVKKMTLITTSDLHIDINNTGFYSSLYLDLDAIYKVSLDGFDVVISSLVTQEAGISVFLAVIYA